MSSLLAILLYFLVFTPTQQATPRSALSTPLLNGAGPATLSASSESPEPSVHDASKNPRRNSLFHANDSLFGNSVPCTNDEKLCFKYNLIFHPQLGRCKPLGEENVNQRCDVRVDRQKFNNGSGSGISGICFQEDNPCSGYLMAYDGLCHSKEEVRDVICGCEAEPTLHLLRGVECRCSPATPIHVEQPPQEGRCRIPDLRFPDTERASFFQNPYDAIQGFTGSHRSITFHELFNMTCSEESARCFAEEKVWIPGTKGCHRLSERGPCAEGHAVALDAQAARAGRAEGVCVHERGGCPSGQIRMAFDGKCHDDRVMRITAPGRVIKNQFGARVLIPEGFAVFFNPTKEGSNVCVVRLAAVG